MIKLFDYIKSEDLLKCGFEQLGDEFEYCDNAVSSDGDDIWEIVIDVDKNTREVTWGIYKSFCNVEDEFLYGLIINKLVELAEKGLIYKE